MCKVADELAGDLVWGMMQLKFELPLAIFCGFVIVVLKLKGDIWRLLGGLPKPADFFHNKQYLVPHILFFALCVSEDCHSDIPALMQTIHGVVLLPQCFSVATVLFCCHGVVLLPWYCSVATVLFCCYCQNGAEMSYGVPSQPRGEPGAAVCAGLHHSPAQRGLQLRHEILEGLGALPA